MIIKELPVVVYDVECFPNLFTCTCYHTEKNAVLKFEISERTNYEVQINRQFKICKC